MVVKDLVRYTRSRTFKVQEAENVLQLLQLFGVLLGLASRWPMQKTRMHKRQRIRYYHIEGKRKSLKVLFPYGRKEQIHT